MLASSIQMFLDQTWSDKWLLLYDDQRETPWLLDCVRCPIIPMFTPDRAQSLPAKYDEMVRVFNATPSDVLFVWDDDDIYCPQHIESAMREMEMHQLEFYKPPVVRSTYGCNPGDTIVERSSGRFHGSLSLRLRAFREVGGWRGAVGKPERRADFDQRMIAALETRYGSCDALPPPPVTYVYRWNSSLGAHCSSLMRSPDDTTGWDNYKGDFTLPFDTVTPKLDDHAAAIIKSICGSPS